MFLHEGLGSVALWRDFPARLAAATGRRALLYSRAGHGRPTSPTPPRTPRFMHEEALDVLPALLAEHGIERPVLVGHSDGGSIALIHASAHPVSGLVLLAPHVFVEDLSVRQHRRGARDVRDHRPARSAWAATTATPSATFRLWNDIWLAPEFRDWNIEDVLAGVTAPTLLIQGEHDQYGTLAQIDAIERGSPARSRARCSTAATRRTSRRRRRRCAAAVAFLLSGLEDHFVVPFERSFDAHYGLEYLEPDARAGRRSRADALGADGTVSERRLRRDRRVAGLDRDRRRGRPERARPVRALSNSTYVVGERARACWRRSPAAAHAARCEWLWDVEIGPPGGPPTALATVAIAVRPIAPKTRFELATNRVAAVSCPMPRGPSLPRAKPLCRPAAQSSTGRESTWRIARC